MSSTPNSLSRNSPWPRALWLPRPSLKIAAAAWIYAGGAHHTGFSQALTIEHLQDFCEIARIEMIRIDADTKISRVPPPATLG